MRFIWVTALVFLLSVFQALGQYVSEEPRDSVKAGSSTKRPSFFDPQRLVPGGNLAMSFGNPYFFDVSPSLGYLVTDNLLLGAGITYIGWGQTINQTRIRFHYYGGRLLGRQKLFDNIYANAELDVLNSPYYTGYGNQTLRKWTASPLVGASYVMPFGRRGGVQATLLYNLNYQEAYSPYASALIWRVGFFL